LLAIPFVFTNFSTWVGFLFELLTSIFSGYF
jgi:hypothetical protein